MGRALITPKGMTTTLNVWTYPDP